MRRLIITIMTIVFICILIPTIFTQTHFKNISVSTEEGSQETEENEQIEDISAIENNYDYKEYSKIKLLHIETGEVEEVALDEYLYHVVAAEMPAVFELEALKAQAIVARTYTIYKIKDNEKKHGTADICDSYLCCQAWISKEERFAKWEAIKQTEYWNKVVTCVDATSGKIVTYEGEPINSLFHANSGGQTELPINVWGGESYPYLQAVQTAGEEGYSQYLSEVTLSRQEVINKIKEKYPEVTIDYSQEKPIEVVDYTEGGRIRTIRFGTISLSGVEARTIFELKSANFKVSMEGETVKFEVIGYGHGVGMSQTGADSLAKQGKQAEEIIHHYYQNVVINNV